MASHSATSVARTSCPTSGGGWLLTSWVWPRTWPTVEGVAAGIVRSDPAGKVARAHALSVLWRLTKETTAVCFRYRVTGLAAEAGFFALLSLPPLLLGLVGSI